LKHKIALLIAFSVIALFALSTVQGYLIRNTYSLEEKTIIREINDLTSQIRKKPKIDSLSKIWQDSLTAIISEYNQNEISKSVLINRIKQTTHHLNPSFRKSFNKEIRESEIEFEIKYKSNLKSIFITNMNRVDTIYQGNENETIKIFGDNFKNSSAHIVNTSIFSSRFRITDSSGNNLPLKSIFQFDVASEDLVIIKNQKGILFDRMTSLLIISILIFLFVIVLLFFSIKGLITQKKIADIKTDFVNNITHEFKTPLATLGIAVKSLENKTILKSPKFLENTIEIIKRQNIRLQRLVDEVMNNSLSSKEINLYKERIFDDEFFREVIEDFELSTNEPRTKIEKKLNKSKVVLSIDKFHLTTALRNILENALKYGNKPPEIIFRTQLKQSEYIINICNKGNVISKEDQIHIFDKFYRISSGNLHNIKGMGLGLYYTKQIVKAHDGNIFIYNEPNRVCFTIQIPIEK
jgi:signal transduction histidine kinase